MLQILRPHIQVFANLRCYPSIRSFSSHHILFISPTLLPEPSSSAAGVRTEALLRHFLSSKLFHKTHFACGDIKPNENNESLLNELRNLGMGLHPIPPNRTNEIERWFKKNGLHYQSEHYHESKDQLKAVIFDRFFSEEAYSFHFQKLSPGTIRILDMQDMHSLRLARKDILDHWDSSNNTQMMTKSLMQALVTCTPDATNNSLLRELAAIHRSDLVLVCSPHELRLLSDLYGIHEEKLVLAPFFTSPVDRTKLNENYGAKEDHGNRQFVFIGGFRHQPNIDAVLYLHNEIWPKIQTKLPHAEMHIYGAYSDHLMKRLRKISHKRFYIRGHAENLDDVFREARVLLCPLRYGAGIKGKIVDGWKYGVPVVTTPIGAEGMKPIDFHESWGGLIVEDGDSNTYASSAVKLYVDKALRQKCVKDGYLILDSLYEKNSNLKIIEESIERAMQNLNERRTRDFISSLLWHQGNRSSEYFSRWIELKESFKVEKR